MRHKLAFSLAIAALLAASTAEAKNYRYKARHPHKGGGICSVRGSHVHTYAPAEPRLFRVVGGEYYFVGDPVAFGYDGERYAYFGPHPVTDGDHRFHDPIYCYLDGAHYHWYEPARESHFEMRAGVHWYVGGFQASFWSARPRYVVINDIHRPIHYARPRVVVADAPPRWRAVPPRPAPVRATVVTSPPPASPRVQIGVGINLGAPSPRPQVVRERVIVVEPQDRYKKHGHDRDDDDDRGRGKGHSKGRKKD